MNFARIIRNVLSRRKESEQGRPFEPTEFIYVKIPEGIGPIERGRKYGDPLRLKLGQTGLGYVSGGGGQVGNEQPDGSRMIEFCGLDVDVVDLEKALVLLRAELPALGIPKGTQLHYTLGEDRLQDAYAYGEWKVRQPRVKGVIAPR